MVPNILITGAAGYIGGSVLADFISRIDGPIKGSKFHAVVRTKEQVEALSQLGVNVLNVDLNNKAEIIEAVLRNEIDIVVHTASSMVSSIPGNLIEALGQRRKSGGEDVYFIHSSVTTMYASEGGWPFGEVRDTDMVFEKEKQIEAGNPVRDTNILVAEHAEAHGVTSFNIPVPLIYGRGTGQWRKLSANIPALVRTSIRLKTVHKFNEDGRPPSTHISDLVALYALLVEKILKKEELPSGKTGYYFAIAHRVLWWEVMQRLAIALHARGLVDEPVVKTWSSYEGAAVELGFPSQYIRAIGTSSGEMVPVNAYKLGWQPKWDEKRFLDGLDDEVEDVLALDTVKASLFDLLLGDEK